MPETVKAVFTRYEHLTFWQVVKSYGRVDIPPASCKGVLGSSPSQENDRSFSWNVFSATSGKCRQNTFKSGHNHFLLPSSFSTDYALLPRLRTPHIFIYWQSLFIMPYKQHKLDRVTTAIMHAQATSSLLLLLLFLCCFLLLFTFVVVLFCSYFPSLLLSFFVIFCCFLFLFSIVFFCCYFVLLLFPSLVTVLFRFIFFFFFSLLLLLLNVMRLLRQHLIHLFFVICFFVFLSCFVLMAYLCRFAAFITGDCAPKPACK